MERERKRGRKGPRGAIIYLVFFASRPMLHILKSSTNLPEKGRAICRFLRGFDLLRILFVF
jgi:hypothetical protein